VNTLWKRNWKLPLCTSKLIDLLYEASTEHVPATRNTRMTHVHAQTLTHTRTHSYTYAHTHICIHISKPLYCNASRHTVRRPRRPRNCTSSSKLRGSSQDVTGSSYPTTSIFGARLVGGSRLQKGGSNVSGVYCWDWR